MDITAKLPIERMCIVCESPKSEGIHLYASFVCCECEMSIIQTDTSDSRYKYYLQQLKKVTKPEMYS